MLSKWFRRAMGRAPVLFGIGAIVGSLGDRIHTYFGVVRYPDPLIFDEAWWVPLLMGGAALLFVESHAWVTILLRETPEKPDKRRMMRAFVLFGAAYLASGVFRAWPVTLTMVFVALFVVRALLRGGRSRVMWVHGAFLCIFGILFETALSATGAFVHTSVDLLGVPLWIGPLYLHAALLAREIDLLWRS